MHIFKRKDLKTAYKVNYNGSVQLETLETLTKDENKGEVVDIPCDPLIVISFIITLIVTSFIIKGNTLSPCFKDILHTLNSRIMKKCLSKFFVSLRYAVISIIVFPTLMIVSCGRSKHEEAMVETVPLEGVSIINDTLIIDYFRPFIVNNNIASTLAKGDYSGFIGGLKDDKLFTRDLFLPRGSGPDEFGFAVVMPYNDSTIFVMNSNGGHPESLTVIPVGMDGLQSKDRWMRHRIDSIGSIDVGARAFVPLSDSTILINSARYGSPSVFSVINYKHPSLTELNWLPGDNFKGENIVKQGVYGVNTQLYKIGDKFLYINGNSDYAFIFSLKDDDIVIDKMLGETYPDYEDSGNGLTAKINRKAPLLSGSVSDNRIYILQKILNKEGNKVSEGDVPSYGNRVVCYDFNGKRLYDLMLDRIGFGIMTDNYNNNLYLCCISEETNEMDIVKYNLSSLK